MRVLTGLILALGAYGCGDPVQPTDVAGTYTLGSLFPGGSSVNGSWSSTAPSSASSASTPVVSRGQRCGMTPVTEG